MTVFMEKVCRTLALRTSHGSLLNFGKYPKTDKACNDLLKVT